MGKRKPAQFDPDETRVIVQNGSKVLSFRLLMDSPTIFRETSFNALLGLARLRVGRPADPEAIVRLVLDQEDSGKLYRCGGLGQFEPREGKINYWVTDLTHRDPSAPKLTQIRDAWEYNYQIYPETLEQVAAKRVKKPSPQANLPDMSKAQYAEYLRKDFFSFRCKIGGVDEEAYLSKDMPQLDDEILVKLGDTPRKKTNLKAHFDPDKDQHSHFNEDASNENARPRADLQSFFNGRCDYAEKRVIIAQGREVKSFRLNLYALNPASSPKMINRYSPFRIVDPGDAVRRVLNLSDDVPIYQCGGPSGFEPQKGRVNFWVSDIEHRDPYAPQLTLLRDQWDLLYQEAPLSLEELQAQYRAVSHEMKWKEKLFRIRKQNFLNQFFQNQEEEEQEEDGED